MKEWVYLGGRYYSKNEEEEEEEGEGEGEGGREEGRKEEGRKGGREEGRKGGKHEMCECANVNASMELHLLHRIARQLGE